MASHSRVGEILVKARVIDDLQLRSARAQHDQWGGRLGKIVADMGLADEEAIAEAISKAMGMARVQLGHIPKDAAALAKLDAKFAEDQAVFPVSLKDNGKTLVLAMADPTDLEIVDQLGARARARISLVVAGETEIQHAILRYYKGQEPAAAEVPRARQAIRRASEDVELGGEEGGEEFKVTDMSGKTMVRHVADIMAQAPTDPAAAALSSGQPSRGPSAGDLLDDMLAAPAPPQLSPEEMQRLQTVKANQEKSAVILRALVELLIEKGYCTQKDLAIRVKL